MSTKTLTPFTREVLRVMKLIPKGKVATYAQIAALAGRPQAVRGVVWILHSLSTIEELPWFRVINAKGKISFPEMSPQALRQKKLLASEGVEFSQSEKINLLRYQWKKSVTSRKKPK